MFRWIKSKWQAVKDKVTRDYHNTTVYNFTEFISNCGVVFGTGAGLLNIVIIGLSFGMVALNIFPMVAVWLSYVGFCILTPSSFIGLTLLVIYATYLRKLDNEIPWWTRRKAEKWSHVIWRMFLWTIILYCGFLLFWVSAPIHSSIFAASFLPNVVAAKLLILDLFWLPLCVFMPTLSWTNLCFTKFKYYLRMVEFERLENREARSTGSMGDWADEDEILDHKLARMGL